MKTSDAGNKILNEAREVLLIESQAVAQLIDRLDERFEQAVQLVLACRNRVVVTGVGKSGVIGRKLASTFASTGTPALFLHAVEGLHGDLGMVMPGDVLLAISYSGRADDLTEILPVVKSMEVPIIAMTGNANSFLAAQADVMLDVNVEKEACPLNLAPTASTTATLAMGDALAICVMGARKFTREDFARFHPGGTLGRSAKMRVGDLMRTAERLAQVPESATVREVLQAITSAQAGAAVMVDESGQLSGYLTDGDVRRMLLHGANAGALLEAEVTTVMTRTPLSFSPEVPAINALRALQERGVDDAPVVDDENRPVGVLDVQELLRAGIL
jgi:arabinose-5-phosphate isomerase